MRVAMAPSSWGATGLCEAVIVPLERIPLIAWLELALQRAVDRDAASVRSIRRVRRDAVLGWTWPTMRTATRPATIGY